MPKLRKTQNRAFVLTLYSVHQSQHLKRQSVAAEPVHSED